MNNQEITVNTRILKEIVVKGRKYNVDYQLGGDKLIEKIKDNYGDSYNALSSLRTYELECVTQTLMEHSYDFFEKAGTTFEERDEALAKEVQEG